MGMNILGTFMTPEGLQLATESLKRKGIEGLIVIDSTYILEKWNNYIGVKHFDIRKNDSLQIVELQKSLLELKEKSGHICGFDKTDKLIAEYLIKWSGIWSDYDEVKEILYFIFLVNTRSLLANDGSRGVKSNQYDKYWTPTGLTNLFNEWIGDPEKINTDSYNCLHPLVRDAVKKWLEVVPVKRDYILCSLIN
jgi:hypothetical protein